jgi:hypothetical protein
MLRMKRKGYLTFTRLAEMHRTKIKKMEGRSNNVDPLVSGFGQIYLTVK